MPAASSRIVIEAPAPSVDGGRFPAKAVVGDRVEVSADVFRDGHDVLRAVVKYRPANGRKWHELPLRHIDAHVRGDRWAGSFPVEKLGRHEWTIEAWVDPFAGWREELERKIAFGELDLTSELEEGARMVEAAGLEANRDAGSLLDPELFAAMETAQPRHESAQLATQAVEVDRERARFSTWYELFPRS